MRTIEELEEAIANTVAAWPGDQYVELSLDPADGDVVAASVAGLTRTKNGEIDGEPDPEDGGYPKEDADGDRIYVEFIDHVAASSKERELDPRLSRRDWRGLRYYLLHGGERPVVKKPDSKDAAQPDEKSDDPYTHPRIKFYTDGGVDFFVVDGDWSEAIGFTAGLFSEQGKTAQRWLDDYLRNFYVSHPRDPEMPGLRQVNSKGDPIPQPPSATIIGVDEAA